MATKKDIQLASDIRTTTSRLLKQFRKQSSVVPVSMTEQTTLSLIDQHVKILASELAIIERVTAQSMSQIINHLQELGFVQKNTSKEDKRKIYISLTKKGKGTLATMRTVRVEWLANALDKSLSTDEKSLLEKAMTVLQKLLNTNT